MTFQGVKYWALLTNTLYIVQPIYIVLVQLAFAVLFFRSVFHPVILCVGCIYLQYLSTSISQTDPVSRLPLCLGIARLGYFVTVKLPISGA